MEFAQSNETFLEFHPAVLNDCTNRYLFFTHRPEPDLKRLARYYVIENGIPCYHEITKVTKRGVPGVGAWFYDGWAPITWSTSPRT